MLSAITDYIKSRRHQLGKHVVFLGSAARSSPDETRVEDLIAGVALAWAAEHGKPLPNEEPAAAALGLMAAEATDHAERCARLQEAMAGLRPSEAHTRLARMMSDGYFPAVFTTDPTDLLQRGLHNRHMEPDKDYHLMVAGVDPADDIQVALEQSKRIVVVKCAGDMTRGYLPMTPPEVRKSIDTIGAVIERASRQLALFVAYTDRDRPLMRHISHDGDRVFWINRVIPMADEELYQELKLESPASVEYHSLQPDVMAMLSARSSARHLLCREAGEASAFFSALEDRLERHEHSTRRARRSAPSQTLLAGGPYRFLDFYDVQDAELFFGREQEIQDVIRMISEHPLSVLFGGSARGKTSLICAGVIATMQQQALEDEGPRWLPVYVRCGEDPLDNIRVAVAAAVREAGFEPPAHELELNDFLTEAIATTERTLVVFIDQFEEHFVKLGDRMQAEVGRHLAEALATEQEALRILISIREDYLGQLYALHEHLPEIMHNLYRLDRLTRDQARKAAASPAGPFGIHVEDTLVEQVVRDLDRDDGIEPAELQIVMYRLYQSLTGHQHRLGLMAYERLEGAERILEGYLDYALSQFPPGERRVARAILKDMVASSELKASRSVERIASEVGLADEMAERVLARLVDLRLVRRVGKGAERVYEVVHEYIAHKIEHWMSEREIEVKDVQDLLTRELNNHQKFGLLMPEGALRIVATYRNELNISPEEMELIVRSAAYRGQDVGYWVSRAGEMGERLEPTLKALMQDQQPQVRRAGLEAASRRLSLAYLPELAALLDDDLAELRERAEELLRRLDRELVQVLGHGDETERRLAAQALGRIDSRRGLRPLAHALEDGDEEMRDQVAEALVEMDAPGAARLLLNRLSTDEQAPWAVAYALGRVAHGPESLEAIEHARRHNPESAQIAFALALAFGHRRDYGAALKLLGQAERLATTPRGLEVIAEARAEIQAQRKQAAGGDDWPTFHRDLQRTGFTTQNVAPPLAVRWRFQTRGPVVASPTGTAGLICVGSRDGYLYALDSSSGALQWELRTRERVEAAPALTPDLAYVVSRDGRISAVGLRDGQKVWEHDSGAPSRCPPAVHSGLVFVGNQEGGLFALNAADGRLAWQLAAEDEVSGAPTICADRLLAGAWDGNLYCVDLRSGEQVWRANAGGPIAAAVSASDSQVYCGSDSEAVVAFDAEGGGVLWRTSLPGRVRSCPAVTEGLVVVGCMDGGVYALSREDGAIVWRAETQDEVLCSPAVAGSTVYIGSKDGTLYALSLEDGSVLWSYGTSYALYSSPAIIEQMVVLGMEYYDVVAFAPDGRVGGQAK